MTYLLSAFKRLECPHRFIAWWGRSQQDDTISPSPSMLRPYSPRHASTTIWRGVCGGDGEEAGSTGQCRLVQTGSDWCYQVSCPSPPLLTFSLCSPPPPPVAVHL